jgi:hypothetical protein
MTSVRMNHCLHGGKESGNKRRKAGGDAGPPDSDRHYREEYDSKIIVLSMTKNRRSP